MNIRRMMTPRNGKGESMSEAQIITAYSDQVLIGAIAQLRNADYLGLWGKLRLEKLIAEARRRKLTIPTP